MPEWVPARLPNCALLEHACTSARKGKCPLPSWCYTRLCVVALIVQGDMLDATPSTSCLLANPVRIPELCLTRSVHY